MTYPEIFYHPKGYTRAHPSLYTERDYLFTIREIEAHSSNLQEAIKLNAKKSVIASMTSNIKQSVFHLNTIKMCMKSVKSQGQKYVFDLQKRVKQMKKDGTWNATN